MPWRTSAFTFSSSASAFARVHPVLGRSERQVLAPSVGPESDGEGAPALFPSARPPGSSPSVPSRHLLRSRHKGSGIGSGTRSRLGPSGLDLRWRAGGVRPPARPFGLSPHACLAQEEGRRSRGRGERLSNGGDGEFADAAATLPTRRPVPGPTRARIAASRSLPQGVARASSSVKSSVASSSGRRSSVGSSPSSSPWS